MDEKPDTSASAGPLYDGPERRKPDLPDRRKTARGGRRAADALVRVADFVYKLLTEPPR